MDPYTASIILRENEAVAIEYYALSKTLEALTVWGYPAGMTYAEIFEGRPRTVVWADELCDIDPREGAEAYRKLADLVIERNWAALDPATQRQYLEMADSFAEEIEGVPAWKIFKAAIGFRDSLTGALKAVEGASDELTRIKNDDPEKWEREYEKAEKRREKLKAELAEYYRFPAYSEVAKKLGMNYQNFYRKARGVVAMLLELYPLPEADVPERVDPLYGHGRVLRESDRLGEDEINAVLQNYGLPYRYINGEITKSVDGEPRIISPKFAKSNRVDGFNVSYPVGAEWK